MGFYAGKGILVPSQARPNPAVTASSDLGRDLPGTFHRTGWFTQPVL